MTDTAPHPAAADRADAICELPGCTHPVAAAALGRKPKYCGRTVDGVPHTRLTAQRVRDGRVTLPKPGSQVEPAETTDGPAPRPVSLARATAEALRDDITRAITDHQQWWTDTAARVAAELSAAGDLDAAAAEVAAAHRDARGLVDAADAARDDAQARARAAEQASAGAELVRADAERAAEVALAERDDAEERADAMARRADERAVEVEDLRARLTDAEQARDTADQARAALDADLARTTALHEQVQEKLTELRAAHDELRAAHRQAEAARDEARTTADARAAETAEARTAQAVTAAELAAAQRQTADAVLREREHAEQRLADLRARHAEDLDAARPATPTAPRRTRSKRAGADSDDEGGPKR